MRILPILFLLPVLLTVGACSQTVPSAIANDDRPASPQPAIASPVTAPLTIESLAGTYKGVVDEKALKKSLSDMKNSVSMPVKELETDYRQFVEQMSITIKANGTFEAMFILFGDDGKLHGKVKLDGNKLIFIDDVAERNDRASGSTDLPGCSKCYRFMLYASADKKTLLVDNPTQTLMRGFVKQ